MPKSKLDTLMADLAANRRLQAKLRGEIKRSLVQRSLRAQEEVQSLHAILRGLRLDRNISQETLSRALGRKSNVISRIETGKCRDMRLSRFVAIAALLDADAKSLL